MDNSNVNIDLIRGHVDTIILRSLAVEDKYGFEILNEIKERSGGLYALKQPTLYSCLKRLEKAGYIRSYKGDTSNGAQRVYYSLEETGRQYLVSDQTQWEFSRTIINNLLSDKDFDPDNQVKPFDPTAYRPLTRRQRRDGSEDDIACAEEVSPSVTQDFNETPADDAEDDVAFLPPIYNLHNDDVSRRQETPRDGSDSADIHARENLPDYSPRHGVIADVTPSESEFAEQNRAANIPSPSSFESARQDDAADQSNNRVHGVNAPRAPQNYGENERNVNYVDAFAEFYGSGKSSDAKRRAEYHSQSYADDYLTPMQLREKLYNEDGYILTQYVRKNTQEYYANQYYRSNKLGFAASLLSFVFFAVQLLIIHFASFSKLGTPHYALAIGLGVALIYPAYMLIKYLIDPLKRKKANFNARGAFTTSLMLMICLIVVIIMLGFFAFSANFENPESLWTPIVLPLLLVLINVPCAILFYSKLYNSNYFHIS